jgi:hypothetical protein
MFGQTDYTTQDSSTYKAMIDGNFAVLIGAADAIMPAGAALNLYIQNSFGYETTRVYAIADFVIVEGPDGSRMNLSAFNRTADITGSGAGGLDTGSEAPSTWYYIWAIAKPDGTRALILSLSKTTPVLPSGYTYKGLINGGSAIYNDAGSDFITIRQRDRHVDVAEVQKISGGTDATPTSIDLSEIIPYTAKKTGGTLGAASPGWTYICSNNEGFGIKASSAIAPFDVEVYAPQTVWYHTTSTGGAYFSWWEI